MAHVEIDHFEFLVGPNDGVIAVVRYFRRFLRQRKAGGVNGEEDFYVRIGPQIVGPAVPLVGGGFESGREIPGAGQLVSSTRRTAEVGRQVLLTYWPAAEKLIVIPIPVLRIAGRSEGKGG